MAMTSSAQLSITVGLSGGFQYLRRSERRVTRPDSSIVVTPAHRRLRTSNPATLVRTAAQFQLQLMTHVL
jgi:hypothetical protein